MRSLWPYAFGLFVVAHPTVAADASGNYAVWGVGQASCHQFVQAVDKATIQDYKSYLAGYLTAYNTLTSDTFQATGKNSADDNLKFLREHCAGHPIDSFERAIQALLRSRVDQHQPSGQTQIKSWGRPPAPAPTLAPNDK